MDILRMNWETVSTYCERLTGQIKEFRPEVIVAISRGGLVPARLLADSLDVRVIEVLGIAFHKTMTGSSGFPQIAQDIAVEVRGRRVLVVDDVADIGRSLVVAKDHLMRKGASEVKTAAIHYKTNPMSRPDYYAATADAWVVYPWETHEMEKEMKK